MSRKLTAKVSLDFQHYTPEMKVFFTDDVLEDMTGNAYYITPEIPLLDLKALRDDLNTKNLAAASGDREAIAARNISEKALDDALVIQAGYVSHLAKGNLAMIASSGFHATHDETHNAEKPGKAMLDTFGNRTHGSIHASIKHLKGSKVTLFIAGFNTLVEGATVVGNQITFTINGNPLVLALTTKSAVDIDGLTSGTRMGVAAVCFNSAGMGDPSEPQFVTVP